MTTDFSGSAAPIRLQNLVILCIDDKKVLLDLHKAVLQAAGYDVLTATTQSEGMEIFKTFKVDLVLTDHLIKGESGVGVAEMVKGMRPEVPVGIYSGAVEVPADTRFADAFLSKSMGSTQFLVEVGRLLKL